MEKFKLDNIEFIIDTRPGVNRGMSQVDKFILVRTKEMIDFYFSLKDREIQNIFEIGMFEGGNMVLLDKLFKPKKLVGIDVKKKPILALEHYKKYRNNIETYYGIYQENIGTLMSARKNFPAGIDLVIDDASHLYDQTKKTFEMIFPLVNENGLYIIEDWAWSHKKNYQGKNATWSDKKALTNFVFELVLLSAKTKVIKSIIVKDYLVVIEKGKGVLPENSFDFSSILRGRDFVKI